MASSALKGTSHATHTFNTRIDIPAEQREPLVELINQQLATLTDLYSQTKYSHWNVRGDNFIAVHKLFDELAEEVEGAIDTVAERASALGGVARGTTRMAAEHSALEEFPDDVFGSHDILGVVADRFAHAGKEIRAAIEQAEDHQDKTTADVFTEVSRMLDRSLYFIEAHLTSK